MNILHKFCLKRRKTGQFVCKGGPFISSHPVHVHKYHLSINKERMDLRHGNERKCQSFPFIPNVTHCCQYPKTFFLPSELWYLYVYVKTMKGPRQREASQPAIDPNSRPPAEKVENIIQNMGKAYEYCTVFHPFSAASLKLGSVAG